MKTWKKIIAFTAITGVALGALAYFAKKKSLEEDFDDEFDDTFDSFDDEMSNDNEEPEESDRNYVPIDLETPSENAAKSDENNNAADTETVKSADDKPDIKSVTSES